MYGLFINQQDGYIISQKRVFTLNINTNSTTNCRDIKLMFIIIHLNVRLSFFFLIFFRVYTSAICQCSFWDHNCYVKVSSKK